MAPPNKKSSSAGKKSQVEERWVEWSDLDAGIKLKAGHPVALFLGGHAPKTTPKGGTPEGGGTGAHHGGHTGAGHHTGAPDPTGHHGHGTGHGTGHGDHTGSPTPDVWTSVLGAEHFDTAKAFPIPRPAAVQTFRDVCAMANKDPSRQLLILGHTDSAGPAEYNRILSDERAATIKAFLMEDADAWMAFYSAQGEKKWGMLEDQWMLQVATDSSGATYYKRQPTAVPNADFTAGLKRFQTDKKLPSTGTIDKDTRLALIQNYMALEGTTVPDATKVESLGCGLKNLIVKTGPGVSNPNNRRTEIYVFGGPITPDVSAWQGDNEGTWKKWHDAAKPIDSAEAKIPGK